MIVLSKFTPAQFVQVNTIVINTFTLLSYYIFKVLTLTLFHALTFIIKVQTLTPNIITLTALTYAFTGQTLTVFKTLTFSSKYRH